MGNIKDFIRTKKSININGKDTDLTNADDLFDIYPNLEELELYSAPITRIDLSNYKSLKNVTIYNTNIREIILPECVENLHLSTNNYLENVVIDNPDFGEIILVDNIKLSKLKFKKCAKLHIKSNNFKNLNFLKDTVVDKLELSFSKERQDLDTLKGIEYLTGDKKFYTSNSTHEFQYHMFFIQSYDNIKDYWAEITDHWLKQVYKEEPFNRSNAYIYYHTTMPEEAKETFDDGIKLPKEEYKRLFGKDFDTLEKSIKGVSKFGL